MSLGELKAAFINSEPSQVLKMFEQFLLSYLSVTAHQRIPFICVIELETAWGFHWFTL